MEARGDCLTQTSPRLLLFYVHRDGDGIAGISFMMNCRLHFFAVFVLALTFSPLMAAERQRTRSRNQRATEQPPNPGDWIAGLPKPNDGVETLGRVSYTLERGSEKWPAKKRIEIIKAMDEAVWMYNHYGSFEKELSVTYDRSVPTADANIRGRIRFGGSISTRVALHEIAHTMGIGTAPQWKNMIQKGRWIGRQGNLALIAFDGPVPEMELQAGPQHFWPYGLNHDREDSPINRIRHVLMVGAITQDLRDQATATRAASRSR